MNSGSYNSLQSIIFKIKENPNEINKGVYIVPETDATNSTLESLNSSGKIYWRKRYDYGYIEINESTYTLTENDEFVGVIYTATGTVTITLPLISSVGKIKYYITDEGGNSTTNNITIVPTGADTIIGDTSLIINGNYTSVSLYNNGVSGWFIY
jgi:hypothetical protein